MNEDKVEFEVDPDETHDKEDNWSEINSPKEKEETKVAFEVEGEEEEAKPEAKEVEPKEEEAPKELEGIETKGAQKRIRQLIKQRKDREDQIKSQEARIQELEGNLKEKEHTFAKAQKDNLDLSEKQLTEKLDIVKKAYVKAIEEDDSTGMVNAQEVMNKTQQELSLINQGKEAYKDYEDVATTVKAAPKETQVQQQQINAADYDPKAAEWVSENEWFGKDNIMTAAALAVDAQLKEEGFDPSDDEFYQEVDSRLRQALPNKFKADEEAPKPKSGQVVAGTSRTSAPNKGKKIKLTQEDVELANKWNIPLERMAARKMQAESAGDEYTTINV